MIDGVSAGEISPIRVVDGREFPAAGHWVIDPMHSTVGFSIGHMVISKVHGRFRTFSGTVDIAEDPRASVAHVAIEAASIDTGGARQQRADGSWADRERDLRSARFLDVERHPEITFESTSFSPAEAPSRWFMEGDLAIRGIARPVRLDVAYVGVVPNQIRAIALAVFSARAELDRHEWGVTTNWRLEIGGWVIGRKLSIELEVQCSVPWPPRAGV